MLLVFVTAQAMSVSCSKDDDNDSSSFNNQQVTISDDGKASNGGVFSSLDDKTFYLDYIKYEVKEGGHLVVSGYDKTGFNGIANIVARITYKGNSYEVLEIGREAFDGCDKLTSVSIPNSVTYIGYDAFYGCSGLTSVTIGNSVTSIGNSAFRECSELTSVTIPSSVTSIGDYAFSGCSGLTSITIPNSVTYIGDYAFRGCSGLTSVTIPNSVTSIGREAFSGCSGLTSIHCLSSTPPEVSSYAFDSNTRQNATLYVPKGSIKAYKAAYGWEYFKNIVEE